LAVDLDIYVEPELSLERPIVAVQPDLEAEVLVAVPPESDTASLFPQSATGRVRAECPVLARGAGQ
jgi:hypothetical protein